MNNQNKKAMNTKYTSGPWRLGGSIGMSDALGHKETQQVVNNQGRAAMLLQHDGSDEAWANAQLISAAPDLLEACKVLSEQLERYLNAGMSDFVQQHTDDDTVNAHKQAITAIAKATT